MGNPTKARAVHKHYVEAHEKWWVYGKVEFGAKRLGEVVSG